MKWGIWILTTLISTPSFAAPVVKFPRPRLPSGGADDPKEDQKYNWLYEKLFAENIRKQQPHRTFKSFRVHLKDTYKIFPDPSAIERPRLGKVGTYTGKITYVNFFPKSYRFNVIATKNGGRIIEVRVHFKNATTADLKFFEARFQDAEKIWNANRPKLDFDFEFKFVVSFNPPGSHFSVSVKDDTRGPYDSAWGRNWNSTTVAHELGHMMGLGDEYQTISSGIDCYEPSMMCDSWKGSPMPHHYYFILRRLIR